MCGIILKSWILPLYSIVAYGAAVKTVDFLVEGIDRFQIPKMRTIVHETDPYEYISVSEVADVLKGKENIN